MPKTLVFSSTKRPTHDDIEHLALLRAAYRRARAAYDDEVCRLADLLTRNGDQVSTIDGAHTLTLELTRAGGQSSRRLLLNGRRLGSHADDDAMPAAAVQNL